MYASTTVSFVVLTKFFIFPFWRKSFIFGESITIPQHLLDQKCFAECYPQYLSNSSLQNCKLNK
ncbi:hypothetical protein C0J52_23746 [Blattella germanica]|nr:hypothetical protein C0J52_23746 [Blattella germanica]